MSCNDQTKKQILANIGDFVKQLGGATLSTEELMGKNVAYMEQINERYGATNVLEVLIALQAGIVN